jgi:hypothetical protein
MNGMKRCFFVILLSLFLLLSSFTLYGEEHQGHMSKDAKDASAEQRAVYAPMPAPGNKVSIGNGSYLIYGFDKKPKLGTVIMKVELFSGEGKKDTSFEAKADAGMPSMKGAHETGERPFVLSKKGYYLLPINIVMGGDREIRLTIVKGGKVIFRGKYNFDV